MFQTSDSHLLFFSFEERLFGERSKNGMPNKKPIFTHQKQNVSTSNLLQSGYFDNSENMYCLMTFYNTVSILNLVFRVVLAKI